MKFRKLPIICSALSFLLVSACGGMPGFEPSPQPSKAHSPDRFIFEKPDRLIKNFGVLKEDETVAWSWISPGFRLSAISSITVDPIENLSGVDFPDAETSVLRGLNNIFSVSGDGGGFLETALKAAIVDMKPRRGFAGRYVPFVDDTTYIEVEIILYNKNTDAPLCKIVHFSNDENFQRGIDLLLRDISVFTEKTIGG